MNEERSHFIFSLAAQSGIPLNPGEQEIFEDAAYDAFRQEYLRQSSLRDVALARYLSVNPMLFRVHLPYNNRVFGLASQLLWYLDEVIIRDPVSILLESPLTNLDIEDQKIRLRETLQFLSFYRDPIEQGFVLLAGPTLMTPLTDAPAPLLQSLLADLEVQEALHKAVYCGYTLRPNSEGTPTGLFQMMLDSGGLFGFSNLHLRGGHSVTSPPIVVGEVLPHIDLNDLKKILGRDPFEQMQSVFQREINRTIQSLSRAGQFNSAILYDRELDALILSKANVSVADTRQQAVTQVLNLSLPYIRGVPPQRLQELRHQMPNAFLEFRARLLEIVDQSLNQADLDSLDLRSKVDREVVPQIRALQSELESSAKKSAVLGVAMPVLSAIGVLAGWYLGVRPEVLLVPGLAGPAATITAAADFVSTRAKLRGHPFFFLWKAQRAAKM